MLKTFTAYIVTTPQGRHIYLLLSVHYRFALVYLREAPTPQPLQQRVRLDDPISLDANRIHSVNPFFYVGPNNVYSPPGSPPSLQ